MYSCVSSPLELNSMGYWADDDGSTEDASSLPDPTRLQDGFTDDSVRLLVAQYLSKAPIESIELDYSWCRFSSCTASPQVLGCCNMTDGVYVWPEGLRHYVRDHKVNPSQQFVTHIIEQTQYSMSYNTQLYPLLRESNMEEEPTSAEAAIDSSRLLQFVELSDNCNNFMLEPMTRNGSCYIKAIRVPAINKAWLQQNTLLSV